ncbi:MAG: IS1380 family transposase [Gemmatimonadaceae bacterium]|nr:IS1380 family transposase [Gemmatimonadaceae bacterium]
MVTNENQHSRKTPVKQGSEEATPEPNKINASTPYDFNGKNLTPYGGLLPVITMLEKLGFQSLVEQRLTSKRIPRAMDLYRFVLGIVLGLYIGFPRLNQLRFIARDPILTGILKVGKLPVQSTFWRFVNALHGSVARQLLTIMRTMRERVWEAANVKLEVITLDTDTTVHTLYGQQMGGRKSYNPKNKGKKSYQPMLTFIAETREYVWGELRNGDRPTGKQIGDHIRNVCAALPPGVKQIYGRADSGFYCREAVEAYEECQARFVISARKTARLVEQLRQAEWKESKKTDAGWECEFRYQPDGWSQPYRFVALCYEKAREEMEPEETEQYQLFETSQYKYRVFVTDLSEPIDFVVWFYNQRGGAENLIKEANNDAGLAAHPSGRFDVNGNHFQLAMLAYNLNCWLLLFNREPQANASELRHTTLATSRLRFLFVAAKIWRHAGRTGVSYSDHYEEKGLFERLMDRLRRIAPRGQGSAPVMVPALR